MEMEQRVCVCVCEINADGPPEKQKSGKWSDNVTREAGELSTYTRYCTLSRERNLFQRTSPATCIVDELWHKTVTLFPFNDYRVIDE